MCAAGYEDSVCATESRSKFVSNWVVDENGSTTSNTHYTASIQKGATVTDVLLINFFNYFTLPVNAYVKGDSIFIPNQHLQGKVVYGMGGITGNSYNGKYSEIILNYQVVDSATGIIDDFGYNPAHIAAPSIWTR